MKYLASVGCSMGAFVTLIEILIAYISKKKVNNLQNTLFVAITVFCLLSCLAEFSYAYCISVRETLPLSTVLFFCRSYIFFSLFCMYFTICYIVAYRTADLEEKKRKKIRIVLFSIFFVIYSVCFFIASNSRIELYDDFLYQFSGPTINIISAICYGIFIVFIFVLFIKNKELSKNQLLPLLYAVIVVVCVFGMQIFGYDFNYLTYLLTFLLAAIFFTTENQDFKLLGELEESKKIADNENVAQSKFLEKISHEVRSPLNNILGLSDILLTEPEFNFENIKADALNIQKSSAYLLNLTNHIADISQIESGKEKVEEAEYALADIIDSIYDNVNKKLLKDDVSFSINVDENLPKSYYGDAEKIKKIILNVLFNAFNYSSNGKVSLDINEIERTDKEIKLEFLVFNTGHLMKEEDFDRGIQDFFENNSDSLNISDNIIALMVAKSLVLMLDGEMKFANEKGKGTRYFITLKQLIIDPTSIGKVTNSLDIIDMYKKEQSNIKDSSLEVNL